MAYERRISAWSSDVCSSDLLRLTAERLLGDERVRTDRTGMNLVVHEVVQLDHVHVADGNLAVELLTGPAVIEDGLARRVETRLGQHGSNVRLMRTVEDRRCDGQAEIGLLGQEHESLGIEQRTP